MADDVLHYRVVPRPAPKVGAKEGATRPVADLAARIERLAGLAKRGRSLFTGAERDGAEERGERIEG